MGLLPGREYSISHLRGLDMWCTINVVIIAAVKELDFGKGYLVRKVWLGARVFLRFRSLLFRQ